MLELNTGRRYALIAHISVMAHFIDYCFLVENNIKMAALDNFPIGVCVKVGELRRRGYQNLPEWYERAEHVLLTRRGRVFVGSGSDKKIFHYPQSEWANPYKLDRYTLSESLHLYRDYLTEKLQDPDTRQRFCQLSDARELGCFCLSGEPCHRDIVLEKLRELCQK